MMFHKYGSDKVQPSFYLYYPDMWGPGTFYWDWYVKKTGHNPTSCKDIVNVLGNIYGDGFDWNYGLTTGQWYTLTERVVANTPGQKNGFVEGYVNGKLVYK